MGILGKQTTIKDTDVLLYKCPAGKQAVFSVNAVNTGLTDGTITMSLMKNTDLAVKSILVNNKGTGLTRKPTLTIVGDSTTTSLATVDTMTVTALNTFVGGTGYEVGDVVTLVGGTSTVAASATVSAIDANGTITAFTSIVGGSYSVLITSTTITTTTNSIAGTGCTFSKSGVLYGLLTINIVEEGNGYLAIPTVTVDAGTGFSFTVSTYAKVEVTDAIEYLTPLYKNGGGLLERSGIVFGAGDQLFISSNVSTINAIAVGIETLA